MAKNPKNNLHTFVVLAYKESSYLETCLKSVLNQTENSDVVIATTTENKFIKNLAKKYNLELLVSKHTNIGGDFDFALSCSKTELTTIAHQDDIYEPTYTEKIIKAYKKHPDSSIIFTDYFELRKEQKVYSNPNLKIKRFLLLPLKSSNISSTRWAKRSALRFGCAICCPAVTFVKTNCPQKIFTSNLKCNVDWSAWEKLSHDKHPFTFISEPLMGHRISEESTTTKIINAGIRTREDYEIFCRFWPKPVAKALTKFYQKSEKSNELNTD